MAQMCTLQSSFQTQFKVSVVGCGNVGATAAYAMLLDGTPTELVLIDALKDKAEGLLLDFEHSLSFLNNTKVTAGARQKEGETRLDLIQKNRTIFQDIIPKLAKVAPNSILLIVSNPVDVLTLEALKLSGFPPSRVFGSGTMLDTARFQFHISEKLCLSPQSIQAFVLGEHGDTSFPVWSSANIAGKSLFEFDSFTKDVADKCYQDTKNAAYRIIHDLGFTCYSIATVIREIMTHIFQHSRIVLPLSVVLKDYYGHSDVALSVPCVLDSTGVSDVIQVPLNEIEQKQLAKSVEVLKSYL
ncbi:MAG: L-lactate dehydrogenase [Patescibacteria group bacterium]